jgi:hypothetical protein
MFCALHLQARRAFVSLFSRRVRCVESLNPRVLGFCHADRLAARRVGLRRQWRLAYRPISLSFRYRSGLQAGLRSPSFMSKALGCPGGRAFAKPGGCGSGSLPPNSQLQDWISDKFRPGLAAAVRLICDMVPHRGSSSCKGLCLLARRLGNRSVERPREVPFVSLSTRIGAGYPRGGSWLIASVLRDLVPRLCGGWKAPPIGGASLLYPGLHACAGFSLRGWRLSLPRAAKVDASSALRRGPATLSCQPRGDRRKEHRIGFPAGPWDVTSGHVMQRFVNAAFAHDFQGPLMAAARGLLAAGLGAALTARGPGVVRAGLRAEL